MLPNFAVAVAVVVVTAAVAVVAVGVRVGVVPVHVLVPVVVVVVNDDGGLAITVDNATSADTSADGAAATSADTSADGAAASAAASADGAADDDDAVVVVVELDSVDTPFGASSTNDSSLSRFLLLLTRILVAIAFVSIALLDPVPQGRFPY